MSAAAQIVGPIIAQAVAAASVAGLDLTTARGAYAERWKHRRGRVAVAAVLHKLCDLSQADAAALAGCGGSAISIALGRQAPAFLAQYRAAMDVVAPALHSAGGPQALGLFPKMAAPCAPRGPDRQPRRGGGSRTTLPRRLARYCRWFLAAGWSAREVEVLFDLPRGRLRYFRVVA